MSIVGHYLPTFTASQSGIPGFSALPLDLVQDPTLSFDARGLAAFLATCDRPVSLEEIVAHTTDGTHTTRVALDELVARGLVAEVAR